MKINRKISRYNNSSRNGNSIKYIVIHYVGAVSSAYNNACYFANGDRQASAHYFVDDTSIWQSVEDYRASWHCGGSRQSSGGGTYLGKCTNSNSIGIEMCCYKKNGKLLISSKTKTNTAALVQYLMKKHNIPTSRVIRHYDVNGKYCPGGYCSNETWLPLKAQLVNSTVDKLTVKQSLVVDGDWGKNTTKALQKIFKITQNSIVYRQPKSLKKYLQSANITSWRFIDKATTGSLVVKKLQKLIGVTADGNCGKKTIITLQKFLNKQGYSCGSADGYMGPKTVKALQRWINKQL